MKKAVFMFLAIVLSVSVMAQQRIQLRSIDKVECVKSDMTGLKASFSFSSLDASNVETTRGELSELHIDGAYPNGNVGEPQLPMFTRLIAIPTGATPMVMVGAHSETDYTLSDYGIGTVSAMQAPIRKNVEPSTVEYAFNEAAYARDSYNDDPIAMVEVLGTMRGITLGRLIVQPVRYNPVAGTVKVFNDIEVSVEFQNGDAASTAQMFKSTCSQAFQSVYDQIFNMDMLMDRSTRDAYTDHPDMYNTPVKMLVICYSGFQGNAALNSWLEWKLQKGYYVDIYYTSETGTTASSIKNFIKTKYNASVSAGNAYTYLIVIGDTGQVPQYMTKTIDSSIGECASDLGYSSVNFTTSSTTNYFPDMYYSRISVENTTQLTTYINKVLTYEKYEFTDGGNYLNNVLLVGGWDSSWTSRVAKPTINYGANNYFNTSNTTYGGFSGGTIHAVVSTSSSQGYSGSNHGVYNGINDGACIVNYTAHGDKQEWQVPQFTAAQAATLTNTGKYFFCIGNCCLTGNFNNTTTSYSPGSTIGTTASFGETMIRVPNAGAIAYVGCSPYSYWYEDFYWAVGAHSYSAGNAPSVSNSTKGVYDVMFNDQYWNSASALMYLGNLAVQQAVNNSNTNSSVTDGNCNNSAHYYFQFYHTFGDGSVMPYITKPEDNNVSHASTIGIGATTFAVSAVAGSYVAITKDNEILGVAVVPSSGTVNVPISGLTSAGEVMVVVTRQQYKPYITTIQAISNNGPYISLDSYTPNIALIGQVTGLSMTFKNVGTAATSGNTTVTLTSNDSNALVVDTPSKTFSSLAVNASTTVSGFQFHFTSNATVGFNYTLHYTAVNGSNTWEGDITITANQVYTVTVASNNTNYGTVSGGGQYNYGASCTVTATPADGYMFTNWTQNGNVVSTSAAYTFTVSSNISLVANFVSGVMIGDGSSSTSEYLPSYNYYNYTLSEQIYTSAELGGAGSITSIAFYNEGAEKTRTYDFYLKTTTKSSFSSKTDWITVSASDKVFSGSVTMVANDWTTITFSTPFVYDGTSNLVLVADDNTGSYTNSPHMACRVFTATSQALYAYDDNTNYNPLSPPTSSSTNNAVLSTKNQIILTKEAVSNEPVNVTVTVNPINAGVVTGGGEYTIGSTCTVTATPNTGYTFTNWTKNGVSVSTNATYSFTVTAATSLVANFTINSYNVTITPDPVEGGTVAFGRGNRDDLVYDFEGGWQGWTTFQGSTTSPNSWMHNTEYVGYTSQGQIDLSSAGNNSSSGFMLSESYISATTSGGTAYGAVTPDNYLVSPQIRLGGSITFYAAARMSSYPAEKFSVLVSESGNNNASYFTHTLLTVTLTSSTYGWNAYTVDLSDYSGMGYVAIRHYDCNDQHLLYVDDVTIVEGVDQSSANGNFNYGETCVVTAMPNTNYNFVNWTENGTAVSSSASYTFTVTGNRNLVANFTQNLGTQYTITANANPTAGGTVSGAGTYYENGTCTLTATAATGYTFTQWQDGNTDNPRTITVTGNATYTANFTLNSYEVTASANPAMGGTISGTGTYNHGATATLTATAAEGYTFTNWTKNGVSVSTNATYGFTVTADIDLVANFTINSYSVTATADPAEGGTVAFGSKANREDLLYDFEDGWQGWTTFQGNTTSPNSWMHNTAYPTSNNNFSTGYGYNSSNGFMLSESYISGTSSGSGTAVTPDNYLVSPQVRLGGSVSFYAGARNTSYCAEKFSVMVSTTDNTNAASFTTVGTWTLSLSEAGYNSTPYTVDLSAYSGMGYVAIRHYDCYDQWFLAVDNVTIVEGVDQSSVNGNYNYGETCTLTATPNTDYNFVNWTEDGTVVSASASYTFTVTGDRDLVANFSQTLPSYTVTATANPTNGGTVTGGGTFESGQSCTLTATANTGYTFVNWTKNGTQVSTNASYSFTVNGSGDYVANFTLNSYEVTATANPAVGGTISGTGTYNHGATATVTAMAAEGYTFTNWTKNGVQVSTNATYSFTVTEAAALVANFTLNSYAITATTNPAEAGTVTGAGTYNYGATVTLTATANSGYNFVSWQDGNTDNPRTITVTGVAAYVANFEVANATTTVTFTSGWNWWSGNLEITLAQLEAALGTSGEYITSQSGDMASYYAGFGWDDGELEGIDLSKMYKISVSAPVEVTLSAPAADPSEHPITINKGANWIGYPVQSGMDVNAALANLRPTRGDVIKSSGSMSMYSGNSWSGQLNTLEPGQGYVYTSKYNGTKTFTYPSAVRGGGMLRKNVTSEGNVYVPSRSEFRDNMSVVAKVAFGENTRVDEETEVVAFVGGECRGSSKLMYVEETGEYIAFLLVYGRDGEGVTFKVYSEGETLDAAETLEMRTDAVVGDLEVPFELHKTGVVSLFPNPVMVGENVRVEVPVGVDLQGARVEVYNTLGVLVSDETLRDGEAEFSAMPVSGVYTVRVTDRKGNVHFGRLIVR